MQTQTDEIYEYSCHEGNIASKHTLMGKRAYEQAAVEAIEKGPPPPERVFECVNGPDRRTRATCEKTRRATSCGG